MRFIEELIRNAQAKGEFSDLKGKGKPLKRKEHPLAGDKEMAYERVKEAGYTLAFLEERKHLRARVDETKEILATAARAFMGDPWSTMRWKHAERTFRAEAKELNKLIRDYNLKAPHEKFHVMPLMVDWFVEKYQPEGIE